MRITSKNVQALDEDAENNLPRSSEVFLQMNVLQAYCLCLAIRRSPRKIEKKAVYVLNLSIAQEGVDNCLDPSKSVIQLRVSAPDAFPVVADVLIPSNVFRTSQMS